MPRAERPDMSDYGVPDDPDGLLPWSWASQRLVENRNYWVVTASAGGRPHTMPVWGLWLLERDEFVFSCAEGARKARNLRANPQISVATDDTVEVVVVEGTASECRTGDLPGLGTRFADKYGTDDPAQGPSAEELNEFFADVAAFLVTPERAFSIIERPDDFGQRATRWVW